MSEHIERVIDAISAKLGDPAQLPPAPEHPSIALALLDSIWSLNVRYTGVLKVLACYRDLRHVAGADANRDTSVDLRSVIDAAGGPEGFATQVGNRQRTSPRNGVLKAEAVYHAAGMLAARGVLTRSDLPGPGDPRLVALSTLWAAIKGQASLISWRYFLMLSGQPGVKADRMIERFVCEALGRSVPPLQSAQLVTDAAECLCIDPRILDYAIWSYESKRSHRGSEGCESTTHAAATFSRR